MNISGQNYIYAKWARIASKKLLLDCESDEMRYLLGRFVRIPMKNAKWISVGDLEIQESPPFRPDYLCNLVENLSEKRQMSRKATANRREEITILIIVLVVILVPNPCTVVSQISIGTWLQ